MSKTGLVAILTLTLTTACRYDKEAHLAVGFAASEYITVQGGSRLQGCAASLGLGIIKELYDAQGHGTVDVGDVVATGTACGVTVRW